MSARESIERTCTRCVLDTTVADITFDEDGVCQYCHRFEARARAPHATPAAKEAKFRETVSEIKSAGRHARHDCVIGVSGGVDSSYAALVAVRAGLRPLAVHVDNGWNSELAVKNIESIVRGLKIDLVTHVIDWEEFRGLQLSLLRAGVVDLELVSDHAIVAAMHHTARRHRIRYVVTGDNEATEATLPPGWNHRKTDLRNIKAINRAFERAPMRTYPSMSTLAMVAHQRLLRIRYVGILSYVDYVKERALDELERELPWRRYGGKHFESIITRFYQGYILPTKFGIDKRKFHFSLLIHSGQMKRAEAAKELESPPYDPKLAEQDKIYVCKKFGITTLEFEAMMGAAPRSHYDYASEERMLQRLFRLSRAARSAKSRFLP